MKRQALIFTLFTVVPFISFAQKAYETENYTGEVNGKTAYLKLANGYIGASKIIIDPIIYYPNSAQPDDHHRMLFQPKYIQYNDYFILDSLQQSYTKAPAFITGRYHTRRRWIRVRFKLEGA